ncbi:Uncharacterised protein [Weeksella virosa]|uniref:Uncharacterized protein n=1 Tax=Weeksella virosa (strain ATCC 43766 / DSM 16922 / JCM 21250 / CCUG 30538 / CDC 9751 / IAM 14551 / NBRC 16016 / NCTC 11634 / CL345/78) TaxID=865938 RepID=F0P073_WEEVC|nr:hypothetical protein Weevi_1741 [Weeksella virosa DSM 16922]SUP54765.1 Uncharacterised protein [Weeksella virosa]VEH63912.1 Uncharacterised protein [Weeksella virosa]
MTISFIRSSFYVSVKRAFYFSIVHQYLEYLFIDKSYHYQATLLLLFNKLIVQKAEK